MGVRLGPAPRLDAPVHQRLVEAVRALLAECRFRTLAELGRTLRPARSRTWLSDVCRGHFIPSDHEMMAIVLACKPSAWPAVKVLLADARAEASSRSANVPFRLADHAVVASNAGWPIVGDFTDWETLGVHRPITRLRDGKDLARRLAEEGLPSYVLREVDLSPDGIRPTLVAISQQQRSRLVLISGDSAAGKTRAAVEAMRAVLPTWRLLLPHSASDLKGVLDQHPDLRHSVVWLDEIQSILLEQDGVSQIRRLLVSTQGPTVLLGTVRTDREVVLKGTAGWDLLDRRAIRITLRRRPPGGAFERELTRARNLADPWIAEALSAIGDKYGIGEWLAAGPQLLRELDRARTAKPHSVPEVAARIVDAAIAFNLAGWDARIPIHVLKTAVMLRADTDRRLITEELLTEALSWAQEPRAGAAGMLSNDNGRGVFAFDYLVGEAAREGHKIETGLWNLLLDEPGSPLLVVGLLARLRGRTDVEGAALARMDKSQQIMHYFHARSREDLIVLEEDPIATTMLCLLLSSENDIEGLLEVAERGNPTAIVLVGSILAHAEETDALLRLCLGGAGSSGKLAAAIMLLPLLIRRGDTKAIARLRSRFAGLSGIYSAGFPV